MQHIPADHTPVLFVIFRENVRSDAPEIVDYFNRQGVTLKVFSGDNPYTVQAAAKTAGMDISAGAIDASTLPEDGPELAERRNPQYFRSRFARAEEEHGDLAQRARARRGNDR